MSLHGVSGVYSLLDQYYCSELRYEEAYLTTCICVMDCVLESVECTSRHTPTTQLDLDRCTLVL